MKFTQGIIPVFRRELRRILHFKAYLGILTVLPAISLCLFAYIFNEGIPRDLPIAVLDRDHSSLSRQLLNMVNAAPEVAIRYNVSDAIEGKRLIREGSAHALLIIPPRFETEIFNLTPTHLEAYISGSNILINGLTAKSLLTTATTFSKGLQIETLQKQGLTSDEARAIAMPVNFHKHILFNPYTNYNYYLTPSFMPMMLLIFTILATIFAIGSELKYASASEWLNTAQGSHLAALAGKLLPTILSMTIFLFAMFGIQFLVIGTPMNGNFLLIALGGVVFLLSYVCIGITLIAITADMRLAMSLGGGYAVMAFSFSGLTYPLMAMHDGIRLLSHLFPFSFFTDIVIDQAIRGATPSRSLYNIGFMMLFWLLPLLVARRFDRVCTQEKYWCRQ